MQLHDFNICITLISIYYVSVNLSLLCIHVKIYHVVTVLNSLLLTLELILKMPGGNK